MELFWQGFRDVFVKTFKFFTNIDNPKLGELAAIVLIALVIVAILFIFISFLHRR